MKSEENMLPWVKLLIWFQFKFHMNFAWVNLFSHSRNSDPLKNVDFVDRAYFPFIACNEISKKFHNM